ncbi:MAG: HNH endonuclease [Omnitrophica WOR_2 bacterium]
MVLVLILVLCIYIYLRNYGSQAPNSSLLATPVPGQAPQWGHQIKTAGCEANGLLQDAACTPGNIFPEANAEKICVAGYSSSVRDVSNMVKDEVYAEYGIVSHEPGEYEVDHLVSLELGGSNDISNLWPQSASLKPGCHEKDQVEDYLHEQVCAGNMTLQDAQAQIATNWLAVYRQMQK